MAARESGFRLRRIAAQDGLLLAYRDYPAPALGNTPVVCLPGLARNAKDFERVAGRLAESRRVICPDYRGRGRSDYDRDWRNYTPVTYLRDLHHVCAASGVHAAVFIGTSLGGILAMGLGVLAPTLIRGVVLNDVGPAIDTRGVKRILQIVGHDHVQPDWRQAVALCRRLYGQLAFDDEARWQRFAEATFRRDDDGMLHVDWDIRIVKALARQDTPPDLWPLFRSLRRVPVLSIRGALSDILSVQTLEGMKREHPDLTVTTIGAIGHAPTLEEPEAEKAIDDLLHRIDNR